MLRSLLFNLYYIALTLTLAVIGLPALLSRRATLMLGVIWSRLVLAGLRVICGIESEVRGAEHITPMPVIYACKHQSAWDIFMLVSLLPRPCFVLKKELMFTPPLCLYLPRAGMLAVNRARGAQALKRMVNGAKQALHARRPLIIYPQGTRVKPGESKPYHPGVAALYSQLMVPVVPVALNSGLFWGRNAFFKRPGTAVIEFLPAIPPGLPSRELMTQLEQAIETASNALLNPTKG